MCTPRAPSVAGWIDRFNLLRRLTPPAPSAPKIARMLAHVVLPSAVLLHVCMAPAFIFGIMRQADEDKMPNGDPTPPSPPPPPAGQSEKYAFGMSWAAMGLGCVLVGSFCLVQSFRNRRSRFGKKQAEALERLQHAAFLDEEAAFDAGAGGDFGMRKGAREESQVYAPPYPTSATPDAKGDTKKDDGRSSSTPSRRLSKPAEQPKDWPTPKEAKDKPKEKDV